LYISKILFLFPVSFTTEYKVGIAEFYLYFMTYIYAPISTIVSGVL